MNTKKNDKNFIIALIFFNFLLWVRFFDKKMVERELIFKAMGEYRFAELMTVIYMLCILGFSCFSLKMVSDKYHHDMYYLILLFVTLTVPMYTCDDYIGSFDIYIGMPVILLIMLCVYLYKNGNRIAREFLYLMPLAMIVSYSYSANHGLLDKMAVERVELNRFIAIMILFSPYIVIGAVLLAKLLKDKSTQNPFMYVYFAFAGIAGFYEWTSKQDYVRAILVTFAYFVFVSIVLIIVGNQSFLEKYDYIKTLIREKLALPIVFVLYPLIIVTFFMIAMDKVDVEKIIELPGFTR